MNINANELLLNEKRIRFGEGVGVNEGNISEDTSAAVVTSVPEATNPQAGLNALMFQGLKNVASDPELATEVKFMNEAADEETESETANEYVVPYQSNIAFQGSKAGTLKKLALAAMLGLSTAAVTTSCDDREVLVVPAGTTTTTVTVNVDMSAINAMFQQMQLMWQQMVEQNKMTNELLQQNNEYMKQLINMYTSGQTDAKEFYAQMYAFMMSSTSNQQIMIDLLTQNGMKQDEANSLIQTLINEVKSGKISAAEAWQTIIEKLGNIEGKLDEIIDKIHKIYVNDLDMKAQVNAALSRIERLVKNGNIKVDLTNKLLVQLYSFFENNALSKEDLQKILEAISENGDKIDSTNELLTQIKAQDKELQAEILNYIAAVGFEMNRNFSNLINAVKNNTVDLSDVKALLENLNKLVANDTKADKENTEAILNYLGAIGFEMSSGINKILNKIGNNTVQLNEITRLLAKIQNENADFQKNILNAIDKLGVDITGDLTNIYNSIQNIGDTTSSKNIESLLNKVLQKLDKMDNNQQKNAKAIIAAIGNIKIEQSGEVDLSSLESMMEELIQLTSKNNSLLESIDGKADVINITIQAAKNEILAMLGKEFDKNDSRYKNIVSILNDIKSKGNSGAYDDTELLKKLDTILVLLEKIGNKNYDDTKLMAKLDKILDAIKDHNITVDVTGKVECNCNCGGNHEGILGDIEDILG